MEPSQDILNSWKEISQYMNRGIRTVQRWERELGLPVRRPRGKGRSAVIAVRSELDHWLHSCPIEERKEQVRQHLAVEGRPEGPRFLLAATEFGITLADLAVCTPPSQPEKVRKTITRACAAYETVLRFRDRIKLDQPARVKLDARLQELKTALQGLGQAV
jgi:hypothetical protein